MNDSLDEDTCTINKTVHKASNGIQLKQVDRFMPSKYELKESCNTDVKTSCSPLSNFVFNSVTDRAL